MKPQYQTRYELLHEKEPDDCLFSIGSFSEVKEGPEESTRWHT
ncbi:hypothetical protein [Escherichia coli]|nr:hypothetical protein [Escherichia coli]ELH10969.1 hypothetical protein A13Y_03520 [Escherichia coli KTE194]ELI23825.1 hypothetical protein WIE_03299 [Escherichia coli KTE113]